MDRKQVADGLAAQLREVANLAEFARKKKLPLRTLARLRAGDVVPRRATLAKVARALRKRKAKP
jgi:hypothetical protein